MTPLPLPPGWLTDDEADELTRIADGLVVLELGAWKGRSTVVLSRAAEYVVSVDRHEGIPPAWEGDSLPDYLAAVRPLVNVAVVVADWQRFGWLLRPGAFGLVYIDGSHDHDDVERDIILALAVDPLIVAFHDYDIDDVRVTASTFFGEPDNVVGSLAHYRRSPS